MYMPKLFGKDLFDEFFNDFAAPDLRTEQRPGSHGFGLMKTDVKETDSGFELAVDLPGFNKDNIKAELKDGYLTISASREDSNDEQDSNGRFIRRERFSGSCKRTFYVGEDVTETDIKARYADGILSLTIPKIEKQPEIPENHYIAIED